MKKSYTQRLASQMVTLAKKQTTKKVGLLAGLFLVFGLAAFSQTNYYVITDTAKKVTLTTVKSWSTDGTISGSRPKNFTDDGQIFNIQVSGYSITKPWTVSGAGSKIVVGTDTTTSLTFTSSNTSSITGTIDVLANSTLVLEVENTSTIEWGNLAIGSTVQFAGNENGFQQVIPANYYNLSLKSGGGAYYPVVLASGKTFGVAGTLTTRGGQVYGSTIIFNGNGGQVIPAGTYYNLSITGNKTVPDTLRGTIYVEGTYTKNVTGSDPVTYTVSSIGAITSSTVDFNGYIPQNLNNGQTYYNLGFTNGQNQYISSYSYGSSTVTLQAPDPELQIGDKITANNAYFALDTTTTITAIDPTDSIITLSNKPTLKLFVSEQGTGIKDTAFITSFSPASVGDSASVTLTASPTFNIGDTVHSQIIASPTYPTGGGAATAAAIVFSISGNTVYLTQISGKGFAFTDINNLGSISFGSANELPSAKSLSGLITIINTFTVGAGSISTNGSTVDFVGKKQNVPGITYDNLYIDEDSATQAALTGKALVEGIFKIGSGKLSTNNTTHTLTLDVNATFPPVTNDTFFVNGYIYKNFASTTPFMYQVGTLVGGAGQGRSVTITPNTVDAKTYRVNYVAGNPGYLKNIDTTISTIDTLSYYNVVLSNYNAGVDTSAQLTFEYVPDSYSLDSTITLAHFFHDKYYSEASSQTVSSATTPLYFTTNGYDTLFGKYAFAPINPNTVPVKFGAVVAAQLANATVKVSWESYSEINVNKYVVEGSTDGINFTEKGSLPAKGASGYAFIDNNPKEGINYYRIKEVDNDGKASYSTVVSVKIGGSIVGNISIYPNPVVNKTLNFALNTSAANYTLKVTNVLGKTVLASTINHNGGTASYSVALPAGLAKGVYFVKLSNGSNEISKTIIVE